MATAARAPRTALNSTTTAGAAFLMVAAEGAALVPEVPEVPRAAEADVVPAVTIVEAAEVATTEVAEVATTRVAEVAMTGVAELAEGVGLLPSAARIVKRPEYETLG